AGHADFILRSIRKDHDAGRYVRPDDLRRYVTYFLNAYYPGSQIEYEEGSSDYFRIVLNSKARDQLGVFISQHPPVRRTRLSDPGATVIAKFDPSVSGRARDRAELIDIT